MARLTKILRSRFFLAALCIVLEFAQLIVVFVLLYEFFFPITILGWIFHICVLVYLINRDEIPEFKLPWLLILCFLPVIGAHAFMLLSSNDTSRKEYRCWKAAAQELRPYQRQSPYIAALQQDEEAYAQANYLYRAAGMPCFGSTRTTYYSIGEEFHAALLTELQKAEHFIFMEYFIVQEGQMWNPIHDILKEKVARGEQMDYAVVNPADCVSQYSSISRFCSTSLPWRYSLPRTYCAY